MGSAGFAMTTVEHAIIWLSSAAISFVGAIALHRVIRRRRKDRKARADSAVLESVMRLWSENAPYPDGQMSSVALEASYREILGEEAFAEEQDRAQRLRAGIWQGSFEPPASWRAHH